MAARAGGPQAARAGAGAASDRTVGAGARGGSEAPTQVLQHCRGAGGPGPAVAAGPGPAGATQGAT